MTESGTLEIKFGEQIIKDFGSHKVGYGTHWNGCPCGIKWVSLVSLRERDKQLADKLEVTHTELGMLLPFAGSVQNVDSIQKARNRIKDLVVELRGGKE
jgi:hypothetical protein